MSSYINMDASNYFYPLIYCWSLLRGSWCFIPAGYSYCKYIMWISIWHL